MIAAHLRAATTNDGPRIADLFVACRKAMADSGIAPLVNPEDEIREVFVPRILLRHAQRSVDAHDGLQLWTFQANARAQALYRRHGFRDAERTNGEHNMERTPDLHMTWSPAAP